MAENLITLETLEQVCERIASLPIPAAGNNSPLINGIASSGSSMNYAREDHVHPTDTTRAAVIHSHTPDQISAGTLPAEVKAISGGVDYGTARIRNIYAGTEDLTPGVSPLASGDIYLVYE